MIVETDNFLIGIEYDPVVNCYTANYLNGQSICLGATTYEDAVCEADALDPSEYA